MKTGALALGAAALLAAAPARAAESDLQQWTELGVGHGFDKKTTVSLDAGIRFDEDVSRVGAVLPEAGLQYRLAKWLRVGGGYRLQYSRDDGSTAGQRKHYGGGSFHTLDAAKLMVLGKELDMIEEMERNQGQYGPVLDQFGF